MLIAMSNGTVTLRTTMAMSKAKVSLWSRSKAIVDLTIEPLRLRKKTALNYYGYISIKSNAMVNSERG